MKSILWLMVAAVPALGLAGEYDVEESLLRREAARLPDGLSVSFAAAERCGLGTSLLALGNEAFAGTPKELLADWRGGQNGYKHAPCGHYHVEICPSWAIRVRAY